MSGIENRGKQKRLTKLKISSLKTETKLTNLRQTNQRKRRLKTGPSQIAHFTDTNDHEIL